MSLHWASRRRRSSIDGMTQRMGKLLRDRRLGFGCPGWTAVCRPDAQCRKAGSACRPNAVLFGVYEAKRKTGSPSLLYCGDNESGEHVAAKLIRDVGFDPVDAGPLRVGRYTEPFALLIAQLAYEGKGSPEPAYRFEWFGK